MLNPRLWTDIWVRAQKEELGLYLEVSDGANAKVYLVKHRPPECINYSICHTPDPKVLLICKPTVQIPEPELMLEE